MSICLNCLNEFTSKGGMRCCSVECSLERARLVKNESQRKRRERDREREGSPVPAGVQRASWSMGFDPFAAGMIRDWEGRLPNAEWGF